MEFSSATEPVEGSVQSQGGATFRYKVRPLLPAEVNRILSAIPGAPNWTAMLHGANGAMGDTCRRALAGASLVELLSATASEADGGGEMTVRLRSKDAPPVELRTVTGKDRDYLLDMLPVLSNGVADSALHAGFKVESDRGNSDSAPG